MSTIHHLPAYLVGMIFGYIIHNMDENTKITTQVKLVSYIGWIISLAMAYNVFYCNRPFRLLNGCVYNALFRSIWGLSICWIVFACQSLNTGGIIRWFLSLSMWQPLSKIGLSIYLFHRTYLHSTANLNVDMGESYTRSLVISDVVITTFLGLLFHLLVEAPISNILSILLSKTENKTANCNKITVETRLLE